MTISMEFLIRFFGLLLGVLARTLLPWLRKVREGRIQRFGRRYFYSTLASLVLGVVLTLVIFPKFDAASEARSFEALFKLFCLAFGFGFGWNGLVLEGEAWAGPSKAGEPPLSRTGGAT
jgi:cytochrome c biogenesis factor